MVKIECLHFNDSHFNIDLLCSRRASKDMTNAAENASFEDMVPLPQTPRFTTCMSIEAQYAIMMGYEDRLRRRLSRSYPEYSHLLQQTLTAKPTDLANFSQMDSSGKQNRATKHVKYTHFCLH